MVRIAADVGGTFTDIAIFDETTSTLKLGKTLTTPQQLFQGIGEGVSKAGSGFADAGLFLHGSTIAINTMLERTGARTALVTTEGFRDIYEIGRINRPDAYNLFFKKHVPLVPRSLCFEVAERLTDEGRIETPLDMAGLETIAIRLEREDVEAIAILFLHSYRNPVHELAAKAFFEKRLPGKFVSASHELSQEYREFERTSTVAANSYLGPRVKRYLGDLRRYLGREQFKGRFFVVQSTGGLYQSEQAEVQCVRMLESGPAAGVIGTKALCRSIGLDRAIPFDMGGTTAKAGVILDGSPIMANSVMIGEYGSGLPIQIPMIDIREVGTGGGSIARIGAGSSLRVGPKSAGANPGPVCYGNGGSDPTVTDANLILGRISAEHFLGGDMKLDLPAARQALQDKIAGPLGLSVEGAAGGILQIATSMMSNVVRRVTTERGLDARDFHMVAFGGAGPLHATLVARELHMRHVIIPQAPGHFSACGMLVTDLRKDFVQTVFARLDAAPLDAFNRMLDDMEHSGVAEVRNGMSNLIDVVVSVGADMRYAGQEHPVTLEIPRELFRQKDVAAIKAAFDRAHRERYGFASEGEGAEIVSLRCAVSGLVPKPVLQSVEPGGVHPDTTAIKENRRVWVAGRFENAPVYQRDRLKFGNRIEGPALVEEYGSTTFVSQGDEVEVDAFGNLRIMVS